jgi:TonB family protein
MIIKILMNNHSFLNSLTIMKISLIVSSIFHIIIFLAFQKVVILDWGGAELRTYWVDLIRPPIEDINIDEISEADSTRLTQEELQTPLDTEDTISLDTKDKRYVDYAVLIKKEIMHNWRYPPEAREYLLEGTLLVVFSVARDGELIQIKILKTSGHEILDMEAVGAIRKAAPFPPFLEHITTSRLNIRANFDYRLTARR